MIIYIYVTGVHLLVSYVSVNILQFTDMDHIKFKYCFDKTHSDSLYRSFNK